jgi:Zn-dependent protease/CBS domain-containing protein
MGWSFRVGRVGETVIRVHVTLLVLLAWYAWGGWRMSGASGALGEFAFVALIFVSILLHEFGHIAAARHYGIGTPDVLLTPIGGLARIARMPDEPRQELVIALAGPLVTLLVGGLLAAGVLATAGAEALVPTTASQLGLWSALAWTNALLLGFNLIPAFPMDGGRVLRALLASRFGMVRGTRVAARTGQVVAIAFAYFGFQYSIMLVLIAAFVFLGAQAELDAVQTRHLAGDMTAARLTVTDVRVLPPDLPLASAIDILTRSDQRAFPVLDGSGHLLGTLTRDDMLRGVANAGLGAPVTAAMALPPVSGVVRLSTPFQEAVGQLHASRRDALPVIDDQDRFVGLITRDNVTDVLLVEELRRGQGGSG